MARFQATVRLFDVAEADATTARRAVSQRLRNAGFDRWHVIEVTVQDADTPPGRRPRRARPARLGAALLIAAAFAAAVWYLWLLLD